MLEETYEYAQAHREQQHITAETAAAAKKEQHTKVRQRVLDLLDETNLLLPLESFDGGGDKGFPRGGLSRWVMCRVRPIKRPHKQRPHLSLPEPQVSHQVRWSLLDTLRSPLLPNVHAGDVVAAFGFPAAEGQQLPLFLQRNPEPLVLGCRPQFPVLREKTIQSALNASLMDDPKHYAAVELYMAMDHPAVTLQNLIRLQEASEIWCEPATTRPTVENNVVTTGNRQESGVWGCRDGGEA